MLNAGQKYCRPALSYHLSFSPLFCLLKTGFTVVQLFFIFQKATQIRSTPFTEESDESSDDDAVTTNDENEAGTDATVPNSPTRSRSKDVHRKQQLNQSSSGAMKRGRHNQSSSGAMKGGRHNQSSSGAMKRGRHNQSSSGP